ncbi:MAG: EamA family transporter [Deltaproteobacteria bacterium]|nr:EamA family transporter [Deltaproteobacteria bacterium]
MIIALILVSALLHASWNALLRLEPDKDRGLVGAVLVGSMLAAVIAIVRWALGEVPFGTVEALVWTIVAGGFEAVYFVSLARAMDRGTLGPVYTISRGGAVLAVWPLSIALFEEVVTVRSSVGSAVVLVGLALSGLGVNSGTGKGRSGAIGYAVASAMGIAGYHLSYKAALRAEGNPSAVFALSLGLAAGISLVRLGGEGRRIWFALVKRRAPRVLAMGILCGGSFLILMEALARGGSGFVLTLRNTSVLFAALLAWVIGERPKPAELFGAAFVAAGAVLMAWA